MLKKYLFSALALAISTQGYTEETELGTRLVEAYTSAKRVNKVKPVYPRLPAKKGRDGWVQVSYVIAEDGSVKNVVAVENGGDKAFINSAISAVKKWKFEPATADGKAIEQCDNSVQMNFMLNKGGTVSRPFFKIMKRFNSAIDSKDTATAAAELQQIDELDSLNMTELFWRNYLAVSLYSLTGQGDLLFDAVVAARHSLKATQLSRSKETSVLSYLLQQEFAYLANHQRYSSALYVFDKLKDVSEQDAAKYRDSVAAIKATMAAKEPILVPAELGESGVWRHYLARNNFSLANVQGRLDKVEIRCKRRFESYTATEGVQWQIPKSWGQCNIHLLGEQNSKFDLVEIAS